MIVVVTTHLTTGLTALGSLSQAQPLHIWRCLLNTKALGRKFFPKPRGVNLRVVQMESSTGDPTKTRHQPFQSMISADC